MRPPSRSTKRELGERALDAWVLTKRLVFDIRREGVARLLHGSDRASLGAIISDVCKSKIASLLALGDLSNRLEQLVSNAYAFTPEELDAVISQQGKNPFSLADEVDSDEIWRLDRKRSTVDALVDLAQTLHSEINYEVREDGEARPPSRTLELRSGACRDTALLAASILR